jgi:hypothetical protein
MEAVSLSESVVPVYKFTQCWNPEIHNINTHRSETRNFMHAKRHQSTV